MSSVVRLDVANGLRRLKSHGSSGSFSAGGTKVFYFPCQPRGSDWCYMALYADSERIEEDGNEGRMVYADMCELMSSGKVEFIGVESAMIPSGSLSKLTRESAEARINPESLQTFMRKRAKLSTKSRDDVLQQVIIIIQLLAVFVDSSDEIWINPCPPMCSIPGTSASVGRAWGHERRGRGGPGKVLTIPADNLGDKLDEQLAEIRSGQYAEIRLEVKKMNQRLYYGGVIAGQRIAEAICSGPPVHFYIGRPSHTNSEHFEAALQIAFKDVIACPKVTHLTAILERDAAYAFSFSLSNRTSVLQNLTIQAVSQDMVNIHTIFEAIGKSGGVRELSIVRRYPENFQIISRESDAEFIVPTLEKAFGKRKGDATLRALDIISLVRLNSKMVDELVASSMFANLEELHINKISKALLANISSKDCKLRVLEVSTTSETINDLIRALDSNDSISSLIMNKPRISGYGREKDDVILVAGVIEHINHWPNVKKLSFRFEELERRLEKGPRPLPAEALQLMQKTLSTNTTLELLGIETVAFDAPTMKGILESLSKNQTLKEFHAAFNFWDATSVPHIAEWIRTSKTLRVLNLHSVHHTGLIIQNIKGIQPIFDALRTNRTLRNIFLGPIQDDLHDAYMKGWVSVLQDNYTLEYIDNRNKYFGISKEVSDILEKHRARRYQGRSEMASLIEYRRSFHAWRDRSRIFIAAREGRPMDLRVRLRWGKLAGGLDLKGNCDGTKMTPLEAAMSRGHSECIEDLKKAIFAVKSEEEATKEIEVAAKEFSKLSVKESGPASGTGGWIKSSQMMEDEDEEEMAIEEVREEGGAAGGGGGGARREPPREPIKSMLGKSKERRHDEEDEEDEDEPWGKHSRIED